MRLRTVHSLRSFLPPQHCTASVVFFLFQFRKLHSCSQSLHKLFSEVFQVVCFYILLRASPNIENINQKMTTQKLPRNYPEIIESNWRKTCYSQNELATVIETTMAGVKYHIKNLTKKGILKPEDSDRAGSWIIVDYSLIFPCTCQKFLRKYLLPVVYLILYFEPLPKSLFGLGSLVHSQW